MSEKIKAKNVHASCRLPEDQLDDIMAQGDFEGLGNNRSVIFRSFLTKYFRLLKIKGLHHSQAMETPE